MTRKGYEPVQVLDTNGYPVNLHARPENVVCKMLRHHSGPNAGTGNNTDMNTNSETEQSTFRYTVRDHIVVNGVTICMADIAISPMKFGGLAKLSNGCMFQFFNAAGAIRLNVFDGPVKQNAQIAMLGQAEYIPGTPNDMICFRLGYKSNVCPCLETGDYIEWVNRDDLSGLLFFRVMIHAIDCETVN